MDKLVSVAHVCGVGVAAVANMVALSLVWRLLLIQVVKEILVVGELVQWVSLLDS